MQGVLRKDRIAILALVLTAAPWLRGGRDAAGLTVILALIVIAAFLISRSIGLRRSRFAAAGIWYSMIVAWSGLSIFWSVNRYQSLTWFITLVLAGLVALLAARIGRDATLRSYALKVLIVVATLASGYGLWLFLTGDYDRLTSGLFWANPYAGFLYPTLILLAWRWARSGDRLVGVALLINATAFVLTYSRASIGIFVLAGIIGLAIIRPPWRALIRLAVATIVVLAASLVVAQLRHELKPQIPIVDQVSRFGEAVKGESTSVTDRVNYLKSALRIWRDHTLLGTGGGTYGTVHSQYQIRVISAGTNAHNTYVQAFSELGLIGAILIIGFGLAVFIGLLRSMIRGGITGALAGASLLLMLHLGFEIDSQFPIIIMLVALCVGLSLVAGPIRYRINVSSAWLSLFAILAVAQPVYAMERSRELVDDADWLQLGSHYEDAAAEYNEAHMELVYNPDTFTGEGINNYVLASINQNDALARLQFAARRAEQAIAQDQQDAQHYFLLARAQVGLNKLLDAEVNYHEALRLDGFNHPEFYDDLVRLLVAHNRSVEAIPEASRGLALYADPSVLSNRILDITFAGNVSRLYVARADSYIAVGDIAAAQSDLMQALIVDPGNREAGDLLKQLQ